MQGRARAGGFAAYYGTRTTVLDTTVAHYGATVLWYSGTTVLRYYGAYGCTASQLHEGAPAQQGGDKRRAAPRVTAERGDAGRRCRAALEKVQA
jgi:hypothetical protein